MYDHPSNKNKKERVISFGSIKVIENGGKKIKDLYGGDDTSRVVVNKKCFYIGSRCNWKISWRDIQEITFHPNDSSLSIRDDTGKQNPRTFHFKHAPSTTNKNSSEWNQFRNFVETYWNKKFQKDYENEEHHRSKIGKKKNSYQSRKTNFLTRNEINIASPSPKRKRLKKEPVRRNTYGSTSRSVLNMNNYWSSDEEDNDKERFFNRVYKSKTAKAKNVPEEEMEEINNEQEQNGNGSVIHDDDDSQPKKAATTKITEEELSNVGVVDDNDPDTYNDDDDDDDDDADLPPKKRLRYGSNNSNNDKCKKATKLRRISRLGKSNKKEDANSSDDEDDNLFPAVEMTIPASNHIVSPTDKKDPSQSKGGTVVEEEALEDNDIDGNAVAAASVTAATVPITNFFSAKTYKKKSSTIHNKLTSKIVDATKNITIGNEAQGETEVKEEKINTTPDTNNNTKIRTFFPSSNKKKDLLSQSEHPLLTRRNVFDNTQNEDNDDGHCTPKNSPKVLSLPGSNVSTANLPVLNLNDEEDNGTSLAPIQLTSTSATPRRIRTVLRPKLQPLDPFRGKEYMTPPRPQSSTSASDTEKDSSPVTARRTRARSGPSKGFRNLGNTCYINASLQMLFTVKDFISSLSNKGNGLVRSVMDAAQEVLDLGSTSVGANATTACANKVKLAMDKKTDKFLGNEQRDAHEFLGDLIDGLHEELQETKTSHPEDKEEMDDLFPTDSFFRSTIQVCLQCNSCGYSRSKEEIYRYLSLDIDNDENVETLDKTVERSLEQYFQSEQREIKCEKCKDGTTASQTMHIISRPKVLLLHLKRFVFVEKPILTPDLENKENIPGNQKRPEVRITFRKNKAPVIIPEKLSLEKFLATDKDETVENNDCAVNDNMKYTLKSIVHHIGHNASSGHYTADAVRTLQQVNDNNIEENQEKWIHFDDGFTKEQKLSNILSNPTSRSNAYMLLYTTQ